MQELTEIGFDAAIAEAHELGRAAFRTKYGFDRSNKFVAVPGGRHIDSKPLISAAAAHSGSSGPLEASDFSGGAATTRILDRFGVPWIDQSRLTSILPVSISADDSVTNQSVWWVNQGNNFEAAFNEGSLWASFHRSDGQRGHLDWVPALEQMKLGDFVVHYSAGMVRGVSRVALTAVPSTRPLHYGPPSPYDEGMLVLVERVLVDVELPLADVQSLIGPRIGPMNVTGTPGRSYLSPLPASTGRAMIRYLAGRSETLNFPSDLDPSPVNSQLAPGITVTDLPSTSTRRAEQTYLRANLLGHYGPQCAICGRILPIELLVAAHIKARSWCSEEERLNFQSVAMLACSLGCDALFEKGFIGVDGVGEVHLSPQLKLSQEDAVWRLQGRRCLAFKSDNVSHFQHRWDLSFRS
jgi:hypothetical protein